MEEERVDGRLCVHVDLKELRNYSIDRFFLSVPEAGYVFRMIETFIRGLSIGQVTNPQNSIIDEFKVWPDEPTDDPKLCVVWNPNLDKIQFSCVGFGLREAEIIAHHASIHMDALSVNHVTIFEEEIKNGGADDS